MEPTDANGAFAFRDVTGGDYIITATALNHLADSKAITVPPTAEGSPGETLVVLLRVRSTGGFEGRVTLDGATDHRGTVVFVEGTSAVALTDATGAYQLADVPLGTWTVTASHANYLDRSTPGALSAAGQVATLADLTLPRDLNVAPSASIGVSGTCALFPTTLTASANDPDGSVVRYEWDFEDDGGVDTAGAALTSVAHGYAIGNHRAKLVVTDDRGARGIAVETFSVAASETTYVSSSTGSPGGPGTRAAPYSTVGAALASFSGSCPDVILVALGYYPESVVLSSDVVIRGGFDPATWQSVAGARTEIWVGGSPATGRSVRNTEISDIQLTAVDMTNPSTSSIALALSACPSSLRFVRCRFVAGNGQQGLSGIDGNAGYLGGNGPSADGWLGGRWVGTHPGRGVDGPYGPLTNEQPLPGTPGNSSGCAVGGAGGAAGVSVACVGLAVGGGPGGNGQDGQDGANGTGQVENGRFDDLSWSAFAGHAGGAGCSGAGGGSGGAGGSNVGGGGVCNQFGGGGGAGASSGTGGMPGSGGRGGGASIAVLLRDSSPVFEACEFVSGQGGDGGEGGRGGAGGARAYGGLGGIGAANGGNGGSSGRGGDGGGGQGGPGGPSWCRVRLAASNPSLIAPVFAPGVGGAGGPGGRRGASGPFADSGPPGPSGALGP